MNQRGTWSRHSLTNPTFLPTDQSDITGQIFFDSRMIPTPPDQSATWYERIQVGGPISKRGLARGTPHSGDQRASVGCLKGTHDFEADPFVSFIVCWIR